MERLTGHAELQALLGAYALDAVEAEEAAVLELHLATCPRCRNELADHREVAALLGYAGGSAPGGVWDRIIASLEEPPPALKLTRSLPSSARSAIDGTDDGAAEDDPAKDDLPAWAGPAAGLPDLDAVADRWAPQTPAAVHAGLRDEPPAEDNVVPIGRGRSGGRSRKTVPMRFMVAIATAAALIVAALGVEVGRLETRSTQPGNNLAALAYRVADANPSARHLTLKSPNGGYMVQAVIISDGTTYLGPGNLQVLPSDETYQMWGVVDGARVSLGVIGDSATYAAFTTPPVASVLAMTVEDRGGVVSSTKTPVVEGFVPTA